MAAVAPASVAVVIPTKNRPDDLEIVVRSLLDQTELPVQLIIVDQSANDQSEKRIGSCCADIHSKAQTAIDLNYVRDSEITGASAARNHALPLVRAEIVLFLDDDVIVEPGFVHEILEVYRQHPEANGVSGIITNYSPPSRMFKHWSRIFALGPLHDDRQPLYWKAQELNQSPPVRVSRFGAGLMSFRMASIHGVRFDENLTGACEGEDVDFCMHLGKNATLLIAPRARLFHKKSPAGRSEKHWLYLHVRTHWYLYRRNWRHGVKNRLCFAWLNIGYALAGLSVSARRFSMLPMESLFKAVGESRSLANVN